MPCAIRQNITQSRLGNSGGSLKNLSVEIRFRKIHQFPEMKYYNVLKRGESSRWLVNWTVQRKTFWWCRIHKNQALVLVNYGNAMEIFWIFLKDIQQTVLKHLAMWGRSQRDIDLRLQCSVELFSLKKTELHIAFQFVNTTTIFQKSNS
jgi:UDP-N-acetylenolpyruvoylglucosamine reductase